MFGHKAMMYKKGLFIDTGDFTGGTGDFADPQGTGDNVNDGDTANNDDTGGETGTDNGETDPADQPERKSKQPPEVDAAYAEARRAKQRAEQLERELQARDQWVAQTFGQSHGITTWQQYQAAVANTMQQQQANFKQQQQDQLAYEVRQLREQGYDEAIINMHVRARQAEQKVEQLEFMMRQREQQQEQQQQAQQLEQTKKMVMDDHSKLKKEYGDLVPEAKTFEELIQQLDTAVIDRMRRGYSLEDAFIIANKAAIMKRSKDAAKQKTLNNINGKSHLKTEGDGASEGGDINIPSETMQMYMDMGMSKKQAMAHYKKLYG